MVNVAAPKRANTTQTKGAPPPITTPSQNLTKPDTGELKPLNFRVPATLHRDFKMYAVEHGISMVELLERCFQHYRTK
jgi:predicted HicB family RNase H-like nuclease